MVATTLKVHTIESAPEDSKPLLEQSVKDFGMLPGLHGVLASSPSTLEAYKALHGFFKVLLLTLKNLRSFGKRLM